MNLFDNLKNNTLIITSNENKTFILNYLSKKQKQLIDIKFITLDQFIKNYYFDYNDETITYLMNKYQLKYEIALMYIQNIYYLKQIKDLNKAAKLFPKIAKLIEIETYLKENNKLIFNKYFKNYLQTKNIIIYDYIIDKFTENIIKENNILKVTANYELKKQTVHEFINVKEEVVFICEQIRNLLKQNISLENIFLFSPSAYNSIIKSTFALFNIPINIATNNKMYSYPLIKDFLNNLKQTKDISATFDYINTKYNSSNEDILFLKNTLIKILNQSNLSNINDIITALDYKLKNTTITITPKLKNAVNIINILNNNIKEGEYVFLLGFNNENYPTTYKDIDYLSDKIKKDLNLTTSAEQNLLTKQKLIEKLNSIKNLQITYAKQSDFNKYFISPLVEELNMTIVKNYQPSYQYSHLYNKLQLSTLLDNYNKYKTKDSKLDILYSTYPNINYLSYDNKYQEINKPNLYNYLNNQLTLSYSSINNYYKCAFRYYLDNILKISPYEETFDTFVGNLFHYILSICFNENFDYDKEYANYIANNLKPTVKEKVFLNKLKTELLFIINNLKENLQYTKLSKTLYEQKITLKKEKEIAINITGIIDKTMYQEENNETNVVVIDYKTGTPDINLNNVIYGINMQLPIYLYLLKKTSTLSNIKIVGFYYQKILNKEKIAKNKSQTLENIKKDNLKLIGYSNSDINLLEKFDITYQNSKIIKSLKMTSNGFSTYSKVLNDEKLEKLINITEANIDNAIDNILNANFEINPKVIADKQVGCQYCQYENICYKTYNDYNRLKEIKNLDFLN